MIKYQTDLSINSAAAILREIFLLAFPSSTLTQAVQFELLLPLLQFPSLSTKSSFVICLGSMLAVLNIKLQPFWSENSTSSGSQESGGRSSSQRPNSSEMERLLPKVTTTGALLGCSDATGKECKNKSPVNMLAVATS